MPGNQVHKRSLLGWGKLNSKIILYYMHYLSIIQEHICIEETEIEAFIPHNTSKGVGPPEGRVDYRPS